MADDYRFHVRLRDVPAELWRRFLLRSDRTFGDLHRAIQNACGRQNDHLFEFRTPDDSEVIAGIPDDEWGTPAPDAERVKLSSALGAQATQSLLYRYDFGDDWLHEVTLEGVEKSAQRFTRRLLDGDGSFPPEDCGGTSGYERCVAAATGAGWRREYGGTEERESLLEWLGGWMPGPVELRAVKGRFDL